MPPRLLLTALLLSTVACGSSGRIDVPIRGSDARPADSGVPQDGATPSEGGLPIEDVGPAPDDAAAPEADAGEVARDAEPARDAVVAPDAIVAADAPSAPDAEVGRDAVAADAQPVPSRPLLVAVGYGRRRLISRDGMTWTNDVVVDPNGGDDNNLLRGVGWGDGRFIAVGGAAQGRTLASVDGVAWNVEVTGISSFLSDVDFGNGVWVAAGGNGLRVRSLDHGASWVDATPYYSGHFRGLAFGNGVFVAVGHTYGARTVGLVARSTDGRMWTTQEQGTLSGLSRVVFGNGVFVAHGQRRLTTTTDGASWTEVSLAATEYYGVSFAGGEFLANANDGLWRSSDGRAWTRIPGFAPGSIARLGATGPYVGAVWQSQRYTSPDLRSWTRSGTDDGPAITEIVEGDVP
jgi:hypothetical protein